MGILEQYERQAIVLPLRTAGVHSDLVARMVDETRTWKQIQRAVDEGGDPTMLTGGYAGLEITPVTDATKMPLVTGGATELAFIPTARLLIAADPQVPKLYRLFASGTSTTAATPGTISFALRIGPAATNTSPLFGAASGAITEGTSSTAAQWQIQGFVVIRTGGTAAVAAGSMSWHHSTTAGAGGPANTGVFGGVSASFDSTLTTTSLWVGFTVATSTTNTYTPQVVAWGSWN